MDCIYYNAKKNAKYFFFLFRFPDLLLFLQLAENIPEVVINKDFDFKSTLFDKNHYKLKAVDFLKEDILEYSKQFGDTMEEWSPTHDNLLEKIQILESLELFLI